MQQIVEEFSVEALGDDLQRRVGKLRVVHKSGQQVEDRHYGACRERIDDGR